MIFSVCLRTLTYWLLTLYTIAVGASNTNFEVKRFELCNKTQGLMKFKGNITTEQNKQYLTFELASPFSWDDQLGVICRIESIVFGNNYKELFVIREKNFCKAAHKYMGEFWYDVERAAQLPSGVCPVPAGRYHAHHLLLDFKKISLQTFPFGKIRFTMRIIKNKNLMAHLVCWLIEVDNPLN